MGVRGVLAFLQRRSLDFLCPIAPFYSVGAALNEGLPMDMDKPEETTNRPLCQKCDQPLIPNPHRQDGEDSLRTAWWCTPCSLAQPRIEPITSLLNASSTGSS